MYMVVDSKRCVIKSFELDNNIFNIDDRAKKLYLKIGVEFEDAVQYGEFNYFFETKEIKIINLIEEREGVVDDFINNNIITIIRRVMWDNEDNIASKLFLGDKVMIKNSLTIAEVTGRFDSAEFYYELDNNFEIDYQIDELIKWGNSPQEERECENYQELKHINIALDRVSFGDKVAYDVTYEYHNGDERLKRFNVIGDSYKKTYNRALEYFIKSIEEEGEEFKIE